MKTIKSTKGYLVYLLLLTILTACISTSGIWDVEIDKYNNLLKNGNMDEGVSLPSSWTPYGSGTYDWLESNSEEDTTSGSMIVLGGEDYAMLYQRVETGEGKHFLVSARIKAMTSGASGGIKLEFHDSSEIKIAEYVRDFTAEDDWIELRVDEYSPEGTAYVTAAILGYSGGLVAFDDVSIIDLSSPMVKVEKQEKTVKKDIVKEEVYKGTGIIYADNPNIRYVGRIGKTRSGEKVLLWSGSSIITRFQGTSISVNFKDNGTEEGNNFYNVIIDGKEPIVLECEEGDKLYLLAKDLEDTTHTIEIFRRTEASDGPTVFKGFELDKGKGLLAPTSKPKYKIEFFGDSITSGLSLEDEADSRETKYKNHYNTYAAQTARNLDAEHHSISMSGIGIEQSWFPSNMRDIYNLTNPSITFKKWNFQKWIPDLVVVNLGQNDYWVMSPIDEEKVIDAYTTFVMDIRKKYKKDVPVILALGNMNATAIGSPWPELIKKAEDRLVKELGQKEVYSLIFPYNGITTHPHQKEHDEMADILTKFIEENITLEAPAEEVKFDLSKKSHDFLGFGAQAWAYKSTKKYPKLEEYRNKALEELNIKFIRLENENESAGFDDLKRLKDFTDTLGIDWIYMTWRESQFENRSGLLNDPNAFADWWSETLINLHKKGIPVEYVELMNEPDSNGQWSTGISGPQFNQIVKRLRKSLDDADLNDLGIVGPGLTFIEGGGYKSYLNNLDKEGKAAIGAWSTHTWMDDNKKENASEGGVALEKLYSKYVDDSLAVRDDIPVFATEYATKESAFYGQAYPVADGYGVWDEDKVFPYYSVTNSNAFAVRVFENTLSILNSGSNSAMIWQLNDEPSEVHIKKKSWGLIDIWGNPKPVYLALKSLYPAIPVGSKVIESPDFTGKIIYGSAFSSDDTVVIALTNDSDSSLETSIQLENGISGLKVKQSDAFISDSYGVASIGQPDVGMLVKKEVLLEEYSKGNYRLNVSMLPFSTICITLK